MSLGYTDEDDTDFEGMSKGQPTGWRLPTTDLAIRALRSVHRQPLAYLGKNRKIGEYPIWKALEERAMGAREDSYLFGCWLIHCIEMAEKGDPNPYPSFAWLLKVMQNEAKANEWIRANAERLLKERGQATLSAFDKANELARKKILGDG